MFKKIVFLLIVFISGLVLTTQPIYAQTDFSGLNLSLSVRNTSPEGVARSKEPVTSGVPLPESTAITDVQSLTLKDDVGTAIPVQFKVLSRWGGPLNNGTLPIRWVLADFQANVPAGGKAVYRLTESRVKQAILQDTITMEENVDQLTINTGAARFVMNKNHFNLFEKVWSGDGNLLVDQTGRAGMVLTDGQGKAFTALNRPPDMFEIEETGPLRAVVRVRGVFQSNDGEFFAPSVNDSEKWPRFSQPYEHSFFFYDCRIHFYAGKDFVKVFFTLENNGANGRTNPEQYFAPPQPVYFDSVRLDLHLVGQPGTSAIFSDEPVSLNGRNRLILHQDWRETTGSTSKGTLVSNFEDGIFYTIHQNDQLMNTGMTHPGWVHLQSETASISMGTRHFWQNFPKKIVASSSMLSLALWPEEGYYPYCSRNDFPGENFAIYCHQAGKEAGLYLFDAGRHKTHEIVLSFSDGRYTDTSGQLAAFLEHPLMALASSQWYADSKALGLIAPDNLQTGNTETDEALMRFDLLQRAMVDRNFSDNNWSIHMAKTASPPYWNSNMQNRFFGWMGFGDLLWSGQSACALHYDWPYSMLLHYLRTGYRPFFDTAIEMTRHRYDIDQYHGERGDSKGNHVWTNHMAFYESDGHSDPSIKDYKPARVSMNSHTWNGGLVLYYLLTGDPRAWDAAEENGLAAFNRLASRAEKQSCADSETRQETWPMLNLINLYRVNGDPAYLQLAKNIAKNRILYREQQAGGRGNFGEGNSCNAIDGTRQASTMYAYAVDPILQIHYETGDEDLKALILRMADFTKDQFLFGGDFNEQGNYRPLQALYNWQKEDPDSSISGSRGEPVKNLFWADLFAYAYRLSGDMEYLEWAKKTFRDAMFYYTAKGSRYINPSTRSLISFRDNMFSGSETKVHGWIGRTNQVYLNTEYAHMPDKTTTVLTNTSPDLTVNPDSDVVVYGTSSSNRIIIEPGARTELMNFSGQNIIQIQAEFELFTISRSGTVVTFMQPSDGTVLKIPATTDKQAIVFSDRTLTLQINNNQVFLGNQSI